MEEHKTMTIESLLTELNEHQRAAATMPRTHALVLAGAGSGKTKTIVARAAYLINNGTPAHRIQILTFTRRSSAEIVERVRMHLGDTAEGLSASTFHTWCMSLIRRAPAAFGCKDYSVIDRDDQLQLLRVLRGSKKSRLPAAAHILNLYSFARNTGLTLDATLQRNSPEYIELKEPIGAVMLSYESRKRDRKYLDYDDILDTVASRIALSPEVCAWVSSQYDCLLVDEMQDTNPLQWKLLNPLKDSVTLFCVGDDAQSIYGFRGADFRNVHSFSERVENSITLKLEKNYRSTQEILDVSNWLLSESTLNYDKKLEAARGEGSRPQLHTFTNEWEEGRWIADDLTTRREGGSPWKQHMILVRSSFSARTVETALLAREIPYLFIGGTKLLESAHVRDVLSVLRIVGNPSDEIAWMRFLTLWPGVGETTASKIIDQILTASDVQIMLTGLAEFPKLPSGIAETVAQVCKLQHTVAKAVQEASLALESILAIKYKNQDWDKRRRDLRLVSKLAEKHTSILAFIEEYLLDPIYHSELNAPDDDDKVTVITVHSAKGTEREVCYVVNVSPGAYPSSKAIGSPEEIEEERRVLYVALTRAKDELIVTRNGYRLWATLGNASTETTEASDEIAMYFLETIPDGLLDENIHQRSTFVNTPVIAQSNEPLIDGIVIG